MKKDIEECVERTQRWCKINRLAVKPDWVFIRLENYAIILCDCFIFADGTEKYFPIEHKTIYDITDEVRN
jgi:hypothetical protein